MKNNSIKIKKKPDAFSIIITIILIAYSITLLSMFAWAIMTALKSYVEYKNNILGFPKELTFENYINVLNNIYVPVPAYNGVAKHNVYLLEMLYNTLITVFGGAFFAALSPCIMAYCSANYKNKMSSAIYWIVLVSMMLPIVGSYASEMQVVRALGIYNNIYGNVVFKFHFLGMYFLVFHATFRSVSKEYFEAAKIDGANHFVIFFNIIFPLVRTMFFTIFLIKFIEFWNDYQTPLLYLPTHPTLSVAVYKLAVDRNIPKLKGEPATMACCTLMLIPVMILFIAFRKMIMGNITMGGVKE